MALTGDELPGRLGHPEMALRSDMRSHPAMINVLRRCLKATREGTIDMIRGAVSSIPAILGEYGGTAAERRERMQPIAENDGCLPESTALHIMAAITDPTGEYANDPLCWPLKAFPDDEYAAAVSVYADRATRVAPTA